MSALAERVYAVRRALRLVAQQPGRFVLAVGLSAAALTLPLLLAALAVAALPALEGGSVRPGDQRIREDRHADRRARGATGPARSHSRACRTFASFPVTRPLVNCSKRLGLGAAASEARSNPLPDALVGALRHDGGSRCCRSRSRCRPPVARGRRRAIRHRLVPAPGRGQTACNSGHLGDLQPLAGLLADRRARRRRAADPGSLERGDGSCCVWWGRGLPSCAVPTPTPAHWRWQQVQSLALAIDVA